jgi:pimeloyl-ACP methyl ester carboxylesterase
MATECFARGVGPARVDLAYRRLGPLDAPPVLMIMGLAAQLVHWPPGLLEALLKWGLQLIVFDNRDAGLSTHFMGTQTPDFAAAMRGDFSSAAYTLSDMAVDAVSLLDHLGIGAAHLVGASMGGAIAQHVAIEHSGRVLSLTSMMASTGNMAVGQMHNEARRLLFGAGPAPTREDAIERALRAAPVVRSPGYPIDEAELAMRTGLAWDRDHDAGAPPRQGMASLASGDRSACLGKVAVPTLLIHGKEDCLCDVSGSKALAAAMPHAQLHVFEGMGHDLPAPLWEVFADLIAQHCLAV